MKKILLTCFCFVIVNTAYSQLATESTQAAQLAQDNTNFLTEIENLRDQLSTQLGNLEQNTGTFNKMIEQVDLLGNPAELLGQLPINKLPDIKKSYNSISQTIDNVKDIRGNVGSLGAPEINANDLFNGFDSALTSPYPKTPEYYKAEKFIENLGEDYKEWRKSQQEEADTITDEIESLRSSLAGAQTHAEIAAINAEISALTSQREKIQNDIAQANQDIKLEADLYEINAEKEAKLAQESLQKAEEEFFTPSAGADPSRYKLPDF